MAEKSEITRVESHSARDDAGDSLIERGARSLWNTIGDLAHTVLPNTADWHLPVLNLKLEQLFTPGQQKLIHPAELHLAAEQLKDFPVLHPFELVSPAEDDAYTSLQEVCFTLDNARQILSQTSADRRTFAAEPSLIVKADGSIQRNRRAHFATQITVEFETGADKQLSLEQKAAARDILAYMRMNNPATILPEIWNSYLNDLLPPPVLPYTPADIAVSSADNNAAAAHETSAPAKGYYKLPGLRSRDGGGFSGSGGRTHSIMPEGIDHSGKSMDIHTDKSGKLVDSLELHKFVDKVVHAVSGNEGNFTSINLNDAGYGISVGIRQWNQKVGELPSLLRAMHQHNPEKFDHIFGSYSKHLLDESWVRKQQMADDRDLMNRMDLALHQKDFQHVQVNLARDFVKSSIKLAYQYGLKSELGLALVCDLVNQTGRGGAEAALKRAGMHKGAEVANEHHAVHKLAHSTDRAGAQHRFAALAKNFSAVKHAVV